MDEEKNIAEEVASGAYDAADRPFDFVGSDGETALVCEADAALRDAIAAALKKMGFQITEAASAREALKNMRFHIYDLIVVDERFDCADPDRNDVLSYLESLAMSTRRQIFAALVSERFRTMDNMAAFNKSVNLIVNPKNIEDIENIVGRGIAENNAFYHVYRETLKKMGKT